MKRSGFIIIASIILFVALGGCTLLGSENDETERTLPDALDLELTTITQLRTVVTPPDSVNIEGFVISIIACPDGAACFLPDGIIISESLNPASQEDQFFLSVNEPEQFENENQYLFSIEVRGNESENRKFFNILGYTLVAVDN